MWTLSNRGALAAADGAPVVDAATLLPQNHFGIIMQMAVVSTGAPATYAFRADVEASMDGTNWFQVVRFVDVTADGVVFFRAAAQTAASVAAAPASALGSAAGAAVISFETPWPRQLRAVTKLQTLTGGASPTIAATILLSESN